jgi:hypothetical protein
MICYNKEMHQTRFNPVLGSSYICYYDNETGYYYIDFFYSNGNSENWAFKTREAAEQTLEWLDQLYGVKFIPNEILKQEKKEND